MQSQAFEYWQLELAAKETRLKTSYACVTLRLESL